jgi:type IV pilus assembly protein PilA
MFWGRSKTASPFFEENPVMSKQNIAQRKQKGFSLIELLIVVAIILIIAAIAIPNFLRSKMAANESSAVASMRIIITAEAAYNGNFPNQGYSTALTDLGGAPPCAVATVTAACLIDNLLANAGTSAAGKSGYYFTYTPAAAVGGFIPSYSLTGLPVGPGSTGQRGFFTDDTGVVRYATSGSATSTSSPIQ